MTTSDTTGDKLVESIRRTRITAAPVADPAVPAPSPSASVSRTAVPATPPQRRQATTVASAKPAATSAVTLAPPAAWDRYRSAGRVWPD
jgi:septal ring-binding cell division protein DamX